MRKGELTRERIVAAAAPIFNERGYAACSMQDVMEATGLEKGGLYRHFASKEELAAAAFTFALSQVFKLRSGDIDRVPSSVDKLRYMIKRFVDIPSPIPGGCPLMNTAIDADNGNEVLRELAKQGLRGWKLRLEAIVKDGIRTGEIRKGTQPRQVANLIIANLEGALMISRLEGERQALVDARALLESYLNGLRAPTAA